MATRALQFIMSAKDNATRAFRNAGLAMGDMANAASGLNVKLLAIGGAAVVMGGLMAKAFGAAVSAAAEFEKGMAEVWTLMDDLSAEGIGALSDDLLELSTRVPQSLGTLTDGLYQVTSAGFKGAEGMSVLEQASKLATAGVTDTSVAADAMVRTLNAYSLSATDAERVSDVLFSTVKIGITRMEELGPAWGMVAGLAASAGVTIEELGAAFATLTKQGLQTRIAGTAIRGMITQLLGPSDTLTQVWGTLSDKTIQTTLAQEGLSGVMSKLQGHFQIQTKDLQEVAAAAGDDEEQFLALAEAKGLVTTKMRQMFPNVRALIGFLGLMSNGGAMWDDSLNEIQGSLGATEGAYAKTMDTFSNKWEIVKNVFNVFKIQIGQAVLPVFKWIADGLKKVADIFVKLPKPVKTFIGAMLGIGAVVFILTGLVAIIMAVGGAIGGAMLAAAPYVLILVGVIAALAGVVYLVQRNWDKIKPVVISAWNAIKPVLEAFWNKLKEIATAVWNWLVAAWEKAKPVIVSVLKAIWSALKDLWGALVDVWNSIKGPLLSVWNSLVELGKELWKVLQDLWPVLKIVGMIIGGVMWVSFKILLFVIRAVAWVWGNILLPVINLFINIIKGVIFVVRKVAEAIVTAFKFVWKLLEPIFKAIGAAVVFVGKIFKKVWDAVVKVFQLAWSAIKAVWNTVGKPIVEAAKIAWDIVKAVWTAVWNVIKSVLQFVWNIISSVFKAVFEPLIELGKILWDAMSAIWQAVWNVIKSFFEFIWNIISGIFKAIWNPLKAIAEAVWNVTKSVWETVWNVIKGVLETVWNVIRSVWDAVYNPLKAVAEAIWNTLSSIWSGVWNGIKGAVETVWNALSGAWHAVIDPLVSVVSAVWDGVSSAWEGVWNGVKSVFKGAINGIIHICNGFIRAWNLVPFHDDVPTISTLHSGGLVPETTNYLLQEGEYVIKASSARKIGLDVLHSLNFGGEAKAPSPTVMGAGGGRINIHNLYLPGVRDAEGFMEELKRMSIRASNRARMGIG